MPGILIARCILVRQTRFDHPRSITFRSAVPSLPILKAQEIPLDDPDSTCMYVPSPEKPFVATQAAIALYSHEMILACWQILRAKADEHHGLDYLQVFEDSTKREPL
jgi:hypothetical protein